MSTNFLQGYLQRHVALGKYRFEVVAFRVRFFHICSLQSLQFGSFSLAMISALQNPAPIYDTAILEKNGKSTLMWANTKILLSMTTHFHATLDGTGVFLTSNLVVNRTGIYAAIG